MTGPAALSAADAVKWFWQHREDAKAAQQKKGKQDAGARSEVTAGKHLDGFVDYLKMHVTSVGLPPESLRLGHAACLPGFFRPTKCWDLAVVYRERVVAAMELKSHIGPSFGNNFNNRTEEAIGNAFDLRYAFDRHVMQGPSPFIGYLMLLEDCDGSKRPCRHKGLAIGPRDVQKSSYQARYADLCERLVETKLYDAATLLLSPHGNGGVFTTAAGTTTLDDFVERLRAHLVAASIDA